MGHTLTITISTYTISKNTCVVEVKRSVTITEYRCTWTKWEQQRTTRVGSSKSQLNSKVNIGNIVPSIFLVHSNLEIMNIEIGSEFLDISEQKPAPILSIY